MVLDMSCLWSRDQNLTRGGMNWQKSPAAFLTPKMTATFFLRHSIAISKLLPDLSSTHALPHSKCFALFGSATNQCSEECPTPPSPFEQWDANGVLPARPRTRCLPKQALAAQLPDKPANWLPLPRTQQPHHRPLKMPPRPPHQRPAQRLVPQAVPSSAYNH